MFKGRNGLKTAIGCLAFVGIVQAAPVELTKLYEYSLGNNGWQEIVSMAASFNDLDNDGILEVGEEVTFSVTFEVEIVEVSMDKVKVKATDFVANDKTGRDPSNRQGILDFMQNKWLEKREIELVIDNSMRRDANYKKY